MSLPPPSSYIATSHSALETREDVELEYLKTLQVARRLLLGSPSSTRMGAAAIPVVIVAGSGWAGFETAERRSDCILLLHIPAFSGAFSGFFLRSLSFARRGVAFQNF